MSYDCNPTIIYGNAYIQKYSDVCMQIVAEIATVKLLQLYPMNEKPLGKNKDD